MRPARAGARHVKIVLPEAVARSRKLVAQRPGNRDHREGRRCFSKGKGSRRRLGFVGINHVDVEVARAIIGLGDVERQGIKDVHRDFVAVGGVAIGGGDGDGLYANFFKLENEVAGDQSRRACFG